MEWRKLCSAYLSKVSHLNPKPELRRSSLTRASCNFFSALTSHRTHS